MLAAEKNNLSEDAIIEGKARREHYNGIIFFNFMIILAQIKMAISMIVTKQIGMLPPEPGLLIV
jgi:hypothetical protein